MNYKVNENFKYFSIEFKKGDILYINFENNFIKIQRNSTFNFISLSAFKNYLTLNK